METIGSPLSILERELSPLYYGVCKDHRDVAGGVPLDASWRAAYCCLTVTNKLWDRAKEFLYLEEGGWDLPGLYHSGLSHGERLMVQLAAHLFNGALPPPDLNDLCNVLSSGWFLTALTAITMRRGHATR